MKWSSFLFCGLPPSSVVIMSAIIVSAGDAFVFKSGAVETSAVEISAVVSLKIGTIVGIVKTIAIVAVPGRIGIISIPGEFGLVCNGDTEANVCVYIYL